MNTAIEIFSMLVFMGSGLAGKARAPERRVGSEAERVSVARPDQLTARFAAPKT